MSHKGPNFSCSEFDSQTRHQTLELTIPVVVEINCDFVEFFRTHELLNDDAAGIKVLGPEIIFIPREANTGTRTTFTWLDEREEPQLIRRDNRWRFNPEFTHTLWRPALVSHLTNEFKVRYHRMDSSFRQFATMSRQYWRLGINRWNDHRDVSESAGINRHEGGDVSALRRRVSEPTAAPSHALSFVRAAAKR